ncbi:hypothetical protein MBLNU230_g8347t1 [Neophaeotheca triangularis]
MPPTSQPPEPSQDPQEPSSPNPPSPPPPAAAATAPTQTDLLKAAEAAKAADAAQSAANAIRAKIREYASPSERSRALQEAYAKEVEAHGQSKLARRLQSGTWQGAGGGAGIGGAVGMGVGTVVGTLVGGITAVPAVGLGALVGAGAGAVHGPFVKLGTDKQKDAEGQAREMVRGGEAEGEVKEAMLRQAREDGELDEKGIRDAIGEAQVQGTGETERGAEAADQLGEHQHGRRTDSALAGAEAVDDKPRERKKPRKLEVRTASKKET